MSKSALSERDHRLVTKLDAFELREQADAWDDREIRRALQFCINNVMPLEERLNILKRSLLSGEMPEDRRKWLSVICDNIDRRLRIAAQVDEMIFRARYPNESDD